MFHSSGPAVPRRRVEQRTPGRHRTRATVLQHQAVGTAPAVKSGLPTDAGRMPLGLAFEARPLSSAGRMPVLTSMSSIGMPSYAI